MYKDILASIYRLNKTKTSILIPFLNCTVMYHHITFHELNERDIVRDIH